MISVNFVFNDFGANDGSNVPRGIFLLLILFLLFIIIIIMIIIIIIIIIIQAALKDTISFGVRRRRKHRKVEVKRKWWVFSSASLFPAKKR